MKQVCISCGRQSTGGNLWCTERNCAAELKPMVLEYGERLTDLTIKKELTVLHTSTIYEATQGEKTNVLVKIAHEGHQERLKEESKFLAALQTNGRTSPNLPTLLPAQPTYTVHESPYSRVTFQDKLYYYAVYAQEDGDILRSRLLQNERPWVGEVSEVVLRLADVLQFMHLNGRLHLALNPDMVLVRLGKSRQKEPIFIVKLLDLGMVAKRDAVRPETIHSSSRPSYIAPEFFEGGASVYGRRTDVYGLGLLLYEMFKGEPAHKFDLKADAEVRRSIERSIERGGTGIAPLHRSDLDSNLVALVNQTVDVYEKRPQTPKQLSDQLVGYFGSVAAEKPKGKFNWSAFWIIMATVLVIILILILASMSGS